MQCSLLVESALMNRILHIHFIYGSVPVKEFRNTEETVPGGLLGGHIYLQAGHNVFGFEPFDKNKIHLFPRRKFNSTFTKEVYSSWIKNNKEKKLVSIEIPLSYETERYLNVLLENFHRKTPYDYAVFGMRCGSSTYQILSETGIFPVNSRFVAMIKIPFPRILRKKMLIMAKNNNYKVSRQQGNQKRMWEKD